MLNLPEGHDGTLPFFHLLMFWFHINDSMVHLFATPLFVLVFQVSEFKSQQIGKLSKSPYIIKHS